MPWDGFFPFFIFWKGREMRDGRWEIGFEGNDIGKGVDFPLYVSLQVAGEKSRGWKVTSSLQVEQGWKSAIILLRFGGRRRKKKERSNWDIEKPRKAPTSPSRPKKGGKFLQSFEFHPYFSTQLSHVTGLRYYSSSVSGPCPRIFFSYSKESKKKGGNSRMK